MNKLSLHNITDIGISREVYERSGGTEFHVITITAWDHNDTQTQFACFMEEDYALEAWNHKIIPTRFIEA